MNIKNWLNNELPVEKKMDDASVQAWLFCSQAEVLQVPIVLPDGIKYRFILFVMYAVLFRYWLNQLCKLTVVCVAYTGCQMMRHVHVQTTVKPITNRAVQRVVGGGGKHMIDEMVVFISVQRKFVQPQWVLHLYDGGTNHADHQLPGNKRDDDQPCRHTYKIDGQQ